MKYKTNIKGNAQVKNSYKRANRTQLEIRNIKYDSRDYINFNEESKIVLDNNYILELKNANK